MTPYIFLYISGEHILYITEEAFGSASMTLGKSMEASTAFSHKSPARFRNCVFQPTYPNWSFPFLKICVCAIRSVVSDEQEPRATLASLKPRSVTR
jgi:hypothetical protein